MVRAFGIDGLGLTESSCRLGSAHILGRIFAILKRLAKIGADTFAGRDAPMGILSDLAPHDAARASHLRRSESR